MNLEIEELFKYLIKNETGKSFYVGNSINILKFYVNKILDKKEKFNRLLFKILIKDKLINSTQSDYLNYYKEFYNSEDTICCLLEFNNIFIKDFLKSLKNLYEGDINENFKKIILELLLFIKKYLNNEIKSY